MYVYLAEPIDQTKRRTHLAERLAAAFLEGRVSHYSPRAAWSLYGYGNLPTTITTTNNLALGGARGLVAVLPKGVGSVGVPMEIQRALDLDIPVCLYTDGDISHSGALVGAQLDLVSESVTEVLGWVWSQLSDLDVDHHLPGLASSERRVAPTEQMAGFWAPSPDFSFYHAPREGHDGDAGYDLTAAETVIVHPGQQSQVPSGIRVELPHGWWALIQGRSSSWRRGLDVKPSIIDAGYRGDLWVDCYNLSSDPVTVERGDRIAQLIPMPLAPRIRWQEVEALSETTRGTNGYGSTGR